MTSGFNPTAQNGGYLNPPDIPFPGYLDMTSGYCYIETRTKDEGSDNWHLASDGNEYEDVQSANGYLYPGWQGSVQAFKNDQVPSDRPRADNGYLYPRRQRFSRIDNPRYQAAIPNFPSRYLEQASQP